MSVRELEERVQALPPDELARFGRWFDAYRETALGETLAKEGPGDLSEEQREEILRRRAAYLADTSIATPWQGTAEHLLDQLRVRRRQKTARGRS